VLQSTQNSGRLFIATILTSSLFLGIAPAMGAVAVQAGVPARASAAAGVPARAVVEPLGAWALAEPEHPREARVVARLSPANDCFP
jgi:hypothetical protein